MLNKIFFKIDMWSIKLGIFNELHKDKLHNENFMVHLTPKHVKDRRTAFIADPFLIKEKNKWYCFYEILDNDRYEGVIGYSYSLDGYIWEYGGVCLEEDWHLSYPYVFRDEKDIYMIPESGQTNKIILYKAKDFPNEWEIVDCLLEGNYLDSSICNYNDKWWMFTFKDNSLYIFYSDKVRGPWIPHKKNPIISNNTSITRPGGRILNLNNKLIRHTQDCHDNYGKLVRQFEILKLTENLYEEIEIGHIIKNSQKPLTWNRDGMHNIDIQEFNNNSYLIAVDGYYCKKVNRLSNKIKKILKLKYY